VGYATPPGQVTRGQPEEPAWQTPFGKPYALVFRLARSKRAKACFAFVSAAW
jgi:hypothetical protein